MIASTSQFPTNKPTHEGSAPGVPAKNRGG
jgi:hypothetical protein